MIKKIVKYVRGFFVATMVVINTLFWASLLFVAAFLKLIIPVKIWRNICNKILIFISESWIICNNFNVWLNMNIKWNLKGFDSLKRDNWYLVISNHQTWVDIVVLQRVFSKKIPFLKFFLKKELIWVPVLGIAWWALDYPFMKRYSKSFIEKNPHLKGKDMEITRNACKKFKDKPVSVMNFVEGSRFTPEKKQNQGSPYKNLLKPRAGGIAFVLEAMSGQLDTLLNVTICYPKGASSFWEFLCGDLKEVTVQVEEMAITSDMLGNYGEDEEYRLQFQEWLTGLWKEKDKHIDSLKSSN